MKPTPLYEINNGKIIFCGSFDEYTYGKILTCNKYMIEQIHVLNKALLSDTPVLICGEPGTGKELYAEYIHQNSLRAKNSYLRFNCATTPIISYDRELFGNNESSNIDAGNNGIFNTSIGGTVLLDEVSKIPFEIQEKLLDFLRQKNSLTNFRIVSITNQDLQELVNKNLFLDELYHLLGKVKIKLLPLRERPEDIELLSLFFLEESNKKHHAQCYFGPEIFNALIHYNWPKNIMELKQAIERMVMISPQEVINNVKLLERYTKSTNINSRNSQVLPNPSFIDNDENRTLREMVAEYELYIIEQYIKKYGSLRKAAYALGTAPSAISRKLSMAKKSQSKKNRDINI